MPYGKKGGPHMESAKQERKNLLTENPVDNKASAMRMGHSPMEMKGSWMSKHSKSALHMGHSPAEMGHSPAEMGHSPLENEGDDEGAARREYDLRQGIVDPKTGKRTFKKVDPNASKKFVTKMGKVLPVGSKAK
jgi:hypothetical protein